MEETQTVALPIAARVATAVIAVIALSGFVDEIYKYLVLSLRNRRLRNSSVVCTRGILQWRTVMKWFSVSWAWSKGIPR